jgi:hypothetical protein
VILFEILSSTMSFPKDSYLIFLPNNYMDKSFKYAAQEYGALATALLDEDKISFDYLVSKIPTSTLLQYQANPSVIPPVPSMTTGNECKDETVRARQRLSTAQ